LDCTKKLAVKVSDEIEVVPRGTYPVFAGIGKLTSLSAFSCY